MKNKFSHELLIVWGYGCIGVFTVVCLLLYLFEIFHEKNYFVNIYCPCIGKKRLEVYSTKFNGSYLSFLFSSFCCPIVSKFLQVYVLFLKSVPVVKLLFSGEATNYWPS